MAKLETSTNWADHDDHDLPISAQVTTEPGGTTVQVEYKINEEGKKVKVTRRIRRRLVKLEGSPAVVERKKLAKFGAETNRAAGPHSSTTTLGEPIFFRLQHVFRDTVAEDEENARKAQLKNVRIKCRICKGDHWTKECPNKDLQQLLNADAAKAESEDMFPEKAAGPKKWVSSRVQTAMASGLSGSSGMPEREELPTLRINNVSAEATEQDLGDLFSRVGKVLRVSIPRRRTGEPRGFAYVSFDTLTSMQNALRDLQGYRYDHLVLDLEVAERRNRG